MSALSTVRSIRSTCRRSAAALLTNPAVLACLLVSFVVPNVTAERLPIRGYTTEHGLAHERVRRIVRDPRGFLWFCTVDGLSRFDGVEFVNYRTGDGLPDPWVTDFLTSRDGAYWVATNGGVARFDPLAQRVAPDGGRLTDARPRLPFTGVAFTGSPTQRQVRVLMEDRAGRVWAGGRGGLSVLDRSGSTLTFRPVVPSPAAMVTSLVEGADGGCGLAHWTACCIAEHRETCSRSQQPHMRAYGAYARWSWMPVADSGLAMTRDYSCWDPDRGYRKSPHREAVIRAIAAQALHVIAVSDFQRQPTTRAPCRWPTV
jgi:hypothetical protein